jgi:N-acyl-phosphatidylethanolamine-hydrolysing phospholipase D
MNRNILREKRLSPAQFVLNLFQVLEDQEPASFRNGQKRDGKNLVNKFYFGIEGFFLIFFILLACSSLEVSKKDSPLPPHHTPTGFQNLSSSLHEGSHRGFGGLLRWQLGLGPHETPPVSPEEASHVKAEVVPALVSALRQPDPEKIAITWIGHSTFLIQTQGINILTDPVFSERCSPLPFFGMKRVVPPGLRMEELPPIHLVLISHNHYDHLDAPSIKRLGDSPTYLVPLGLSKWFDKRGIKNVKEFDWWQSFVLDGLEYHCVPVRHFSGRSPFDRNKTLWSAWVIRSKPGNIFFAGDTGYSPVFKEIGDRLGPMEVSLIPIGAYRPRWFMSPVHVNPPEAIQVLKDSRSERAVASHWGTFKLSDEPLGEPPLYLKKSLEKSGLGEEKFILMKIGETRTFSGKDDGGRSESAKRLF